MEECREYKLGDVVNILDYKRVPLSSKERSTRHGFYPYYGAQGIIDYIDDFIFDGTYLLIAEDGENLKSKKQNIAQLASGKYWVNNHAHIVESNGLCDIRYLCYLLNIMDLSGYITGSAQPKLNQANMSAIAINLPSLSTQKRVADFISTFDDKIEVNRRINENLEQQAQALFKSWFVDFEPFKDGEFVESELGMIPKGWSVGKLGDFCNVFTGKKDVKQSLYKGLYPFFSCSPNHTYSNEFIYDGPSIIIAGNGSYTGRTSFYFGKFDLYQRTYACTIKEGINEKNISFIYYMMKCMFEPEKLGGTRGSSIPYIVMNDIVLQTFAIKESLVEKFSDFAYSIMTKIQKNQLESRRLAEIRDTLLPRLMSGEIKVGDVAL